MNTAAVRATHVRSPPGRIKSACRTEPSRRHLSNSSDKCALAAAKLEVVNHRIGRDSGSDVCGAILHMQEKRCGMRLIIFVIIVVDYDLRVKGCIPGEAACVATPYIQ